MKFLNLLTINISLVGPLRLLQTPYKKKGCFYSPPSISLFRILSPSLFFPFLSPSDSLLSSPFLPSPCSPFLSPLSLTPSATHCYCGVLNSIYFKVTEMPDLQGVLTHAHHSVRASECSFWHLVLLLSEIMVFCLIVYFRVRFVVTYFHLFPTKVFIQPCFHRLYYNHVSIDCTALGWGRHVCILKTRFHPLPISILLTEKPSSVSLHFFCLFGVCFLSHWFNLCPCNFQQFYCLQLFYLMLLMFLVCSFS